MVTLHCTTCTTWGFAVFNSNYWRQSTLHVNIKLVRTGGQNELHWNDHDSSVSTAVASTEVQAFVRVCHSQYPEDDAVTVVVRSDIAIDMEGSCGGTACERVPSEIPAAKSSSSRLVEAIGLGFEVGARSRHVSRASHRPERRPHTNAAVAAPSIYPPNLPDAAQPPYIYRSARATSSKYHPVNLNHKTIPKV